MLSTIRRLSKKYGFNESDAYRKAIAKVFKEKSDISDIHMAISDDILWQNLLEGRATYLQDFQDKARYILKNYGTSLPCNRFDVGNSLEFLLGDYIRNCGMTVDQLPNAKRIDITVNQTYGLSIKYSSSGDIKLHNSNNCVNTDMCMTNLILMTPEKVYLITNENLADHGINVNDYLKNTGDALSLKRNILTQFRKTDFPYNFDIDFKIEKSECEHKSCAEVFYRQAMADFEALKL
tara:strand:+ start:268 stop:975 length:708 start_codon:yes stop_codon:yes gene_type:complete